MIEGAASDDATSTQAPTNTDRLRVHLKPEGLARALLDAWVAGDPASAQVRMLEALAAFHEPKQATDGGSQASED